MESATRRLKVAPEVPRLEVSDVRVLKTLEDENRKLKRTLVEAMLDMARLRGSRTKLLTPSPQRMV